MSNFRPDAIGCAKRCKGSVLLPLLVLMVLLFGLCAGMLSLSVLQLSVDTLTGTRIARGAEVRHSLCRALEEAAMQDLEQVCVEPRSLRVRQIAEALLPGGEIRVSQSAGLESEGGPVAFPSRLPLENCDSKVAVELLRFGFRAPQLVSNLGSGRYQLHWEQAGLRESLGLEVNSVGIPLCDLPPLDGAGAKAMLVEGSAWQRLRVAQRALVSRLFSPSGVGRVLAAAGSEATVIVGGRDPSHPALALSGGGPVLDVSKIPGHYAVISLPQGGSDLFLQDEGGSLEPLVLMLLGPPEKAPRFHLGDCRRPVLLLCSGVRLSVASACRWNGGLILGPAASLEGVGVLEISCAFVGGQDASLQVCLTGTMPERLRHLYPRLGFAMVREVAL